MAYRSRWAAVGRGIRKEGVGRRRHKYGGMRVRDILKLKLKQGRIKRAPTGTGFPGWSGIPHLRWEELDAGARAGEPGYRTAKKLLTDSRFDR